MKKYFTPLFKTVLLVCTLLPAANAYAFPTDTYTQSSALAQGKWVKISVENSGMHFIPASTLRSWGFTSAANVNVHGYGAQRISDILSLTEFIDDLPQIPSVATEQGIWFYAKGPLSENLWKNRYIVHSRNPFTDLGYYFLTDNSGARLEPQPTANPGAGSPYTTFYQRVTHERDLITYSQSGHNLYGESFVENPNITLKFDMPGRVETDPVWTLTTVATDGKANCTLSTTANGVPATTTQTIRSTAVAGWGTSAEFDQSFNTDGNSLSYSMAFTRGAGVGNANLDYVSINYVRRLNLDGEQLPFSTNNYQLQLSGASQNTAVWDVTNHIKPQQVNAESADGNLTWTATQGGLRQYCAWNPSVNLPQPKFVEYVANQNLHNPDITPDMVIFTISDWAKQAERIANLHRYGPDSLNVMVVDQNLVFNEFGSGSPDAGAFRRMLKMLYDRGLENNRPLRYVLFFGRPTFDNRLLTDQMRSLKQKFMPTWQTDNSLSDAQSYTTDEIFAQLDDYIGASLATSKSRIAVGRIPVRSVKEATAYVDKMIRYLEKSNNTSWKNNVMTVADNADKATHMKQADAMGAEMKKTSGGSKLDYNKIYLDLYDVVGGTCEEARSRMYRQLEEGTVLWNYVGHGSMTSLTGENMLRPSDIERNMFHRNLPVMLAATCSFMRWDCATPSGGENMAFMPNGGVVAMICPTRTAAITANGYFTKQFGHEVFSTDSLGRTLPLGDILMNVHNSLAELRNTQGTVVGDMNRLRYSLLGDPAMRMNIPSATVKLETIQGDDVESGEQITIKARQNVELTGSVVDAAGETITSFNGPLHVTLYDAQRSLTTKGLDYDGTEGTPFTYEDKGQLLFQGRSTVENGKFTLRMAMPADIADNFRPAQLNMYACSDDGKTEANGCNSNFYVFGVDIDAVPDSIPPVIESMYLNNPSFQPGGIVNESPMFFAEISDNIGINLSSAGIGHQMTLRIDDSTVLSDVSLYYTPAADGSPAGTIAYPLDKLAPGKHNIALRIWDTSGNSTTQSFDFTVAEGVEPSILDIYTDANPASVEANFYLAHDMPDATLNVCFEVFDMMGRKIWTSSVTDRSDMFQSAPVKWDLRTLSGQRVQRGIYIYRATIRTENGTIRSHAKRLAVTGK